MVRAWSEQESMWAWSEHGQGQSMGMARACSKHGQGILRACSEHGQGMLRASEGREERVARGNEPAANPPASCMRRPRRHRRL